MAVTSLAERVPVDRITAEARQVRPARALLTLVAAVLFAVGWTAAKVLGAVWLGLAWCGTAVKVGWQEARTSGARRPAR